MTEQTIIIRDHRLAEWACNLIRELPVEPVHEVRIKRYRKRRSIAQNRMLWMWYGEIARHVFESTGERYSTDDVHEWCKAQFLGRYAVEIGGKPKAVVRSTAKLTTAEFTDYLERIDHYCAEDLGLQLPHPDDVYYEAMGRAA